MSNNAFDPGEGASSSHMGEMGGIGAYMSDF